MTDTLLSLDVGTTAAKAVWFDLDGNELATAERAFPLHTPQATFAEIDPDELWNAVLGVLSEIGARLGNHRLLALAIASQGGSLTADDAAMQSTCPIITWMDTRSALIVTEWLANGVDETVRRISGWSLDPGLPLPMIEWLRRERPDDFARSARFLSVSDFLVARLTGVYATNPSMAGEMLLTDIAGGDWSPELCALVGIQPSQLSPILPSTAVIGNLLPAVCQATGLPPGTPVVNGGQDHSCEALAVGMVTPGKALLACGTAWVINGVSVRAKMSTIPTSMNLNFHVQPDVWIISQFLGGLGGTTEWWVNRFWQNAAAHQPLDRAGLYAVFETALAGTKPGAGGLFFLPLAGSRQLENAPGCGGFWGLRLHHTRADLSRAVLEGSVFELVWSLERLKDAGMPVKQLWMIGGAARNPLLTQIVADACGVPVWLTQYSHGPALGAAMLAGMGLGLFDSHEAARRVFAVQSRVVEPNPGNSRTYTDLFWRYRRLAEASQGLVAPSHP
ncbi:MAG: hypothetical protein HPY76_01295 [Anaerolineae bacterium]|nr:hypothetical protein [Anaerolineae bacterium]